MNVSELARQLRVHPKEMLRILPEYGFDIGMKAVKIDTRVASQIQKMWPRIKREVERKQQLEAEEKRKLERELRQQSGHTVVVGEIITVRELADKMSLPVTQVMTELMKNGVLANQNQNIDYDTASIIASELGFGIEKEEGQKKIDVEKEIQATAAVEQAFANAKNLTPRPPVIVVMGHVDHGKTTLLDAVRQTNIVSTESGGITQHIGAYQTIWQDPKTKEKRALTFIDTPGHEAFTVMRSRGAKVADIAILVVAADDGVKPQTLEAIQIIRAAKLPFVVAINKIDREGADLQRVKTELSNHDVIPEEWGGTVPMVEISAKQKLNMDKLLDVLLLVADLHADSIQSDAGIPAVGTIIESRFDKHTGPVVTLLVQAGTLRQNDAVVVNGEIYGKVRAMKNYHGEVIQAATPSTPVQIIGFKVSPVVGDVMDLSQLATATKIDVKQKKNEQTGAEKHVVSSTNMHSQSESEEEMKTLNLIIKADVLGSLEAIIGSLEKMKNEEVGVKVIGKGLGHVTEDDVMKAEAGGGRILAFKVKPTVNAEAMLREKDIEVPRFDVIYALTDWVRVELEKLLSAEKIVVELGTMQIKGIFRTEKTWMIVGGSIDTGKVVKDCKARVSRGGEIIGEGKITSCQAGQQEKKELPSGTEGGVRFEGKIKLEKGDILEAYTEESKRKILALQSDHA